MGLPAAADGAHRRRRDPLRGPRSAAAESQTDGRSARPPAGNDFSGTDVGPQPGVLTIGEQLCEPPIRHLGATPKAAWHQAIQLLSEVGLARGDSLMTRYPHQLSGGMLQRVMIAMALSCRPKLLIADRTHHRARRDRAGADPTPAAGSGAGQPDGDDADYPRPGGDRADGRAGGGDVCRTNCGNKAPPRKCYGILSIPTRGG